MPASVTISAPSRLHFGLFGFGQTSGPRFGGVGAMIDRPGMELTLTESDRLTASGPHAERASEIARTVHAAFGQAGQPCCEIRIHHAPPLHVGLGAGTQLALALARGMAALAERPAPSPELLAQWTGRGRRSAVGTHGFVHGGLLAESGKLAKQTLSPLARRIELPALWRFVLVRPRGERGISGEQEQQAFEQLTGPASDRAQAARAIVFDSLLPAVEAADFPAAAESLYRFGRRAGDAFAAWQGGTFASGRLAELVASLRAAGYAGAGQSSWGPTLFVLVKNSAQADACVALLRARADAEELQIDIAAPCNDGAKVLCDGV